MDIYLIASQFGKYPGLPNSTSVNNCYLFARPKYIAIEGSGFVRANFKVLSTSFLFGIEWKENAEITLVRSI